MSNPRTLITMMEEQAAALRSDLVVLEQATATLKRLHGNAVPLLEAPGLSRAKPKSKSAAVTLPEGVSNDSTLEPDYVINDAPLFFTDRERLLFDTLNDAPDGAFVSVADCMKGAGCEKQSVLYVLLSDLKKKLNVAKCTIENARGVGYRLVTV